MRQFVRLLVRQWIFLTPLVLLSSVSVRADVGQDLTRFFSKLGGAANVSNPGAYKDQTAGYYTGGNLFARTQVRWWVLQELNL